MHGILGGRWRRRGVNYRAGRRLRRVGAPLAAGAVACCLALLPLLAPGPAPRPAAGKAGAVRLTADQLVYRSDQQPAFHLQARPQPANNALGWLGLGRAYAAVSQVEGIVSYNDHILDMPVRAERQAGGGYLLTIDPRGPIKPGQYTLKATVATDEGVVSESQNFAWGVLAVNFDKSVYTPGTTAHIQIGVLNAAGHTLCDAPLTLIVTAPDGRTDQPAAKPSGVCAGDSYVNVPDYEAEYETRSPGQYKVVVQLANSPYRLEDSFVVRPVQAVPFDISRSGPTRIFPPSPYAMELSVTARRDFAGTVSDSMPSSFKILDARGAQVVDSGGRHVLTWQVDWKAGQTYRLHYSFRAPQVSPAFYFMGPLRLQQGGQTVLQEAHPWQIAGDAVITFITETAENVASTASHTISVTSTAGDLLVLVIGLTANNENLSSVTDSAGNTWVIPSSSYDSTSGDPPSAYHGVANNQFIMAYAANAAAVSSVTINLPVAVAFTYDLSEFSNVATSTPVDVSAAGDFTSSSVQTTPSITTTNASDLIIGGMNSTSNVTYSMDANSSSYTQLAVGAYYVGAAYQVVSATGAYSFTMDWSAAKTGSGGIMAFKGAAAPACSAPTTDQLMRGGQYFCNNAKAGGLWWAQ